MISIKHIFCVNGNIKNKNTYIYPSVDRCIHFSNYESQNDFIIPNKPIKPYCLLT